MYANLFFLNENKKEIKTSRDVFVILNRKCILRRNGAQLELNNSINDEIDLHAASPLRYDYAKIGQLYILFEWMSPSTQ